MLGAEYSFLERRNDTGHIFSKDVQVNDFVKFEIVPVMVLLLTSCTQQPTGAAEMDCLALLANVAHCLFVTADFLESIMNIQEICDVDGSLKL